MDSEERKRLSAILKLGRKRSKEIVRVHGHSMSFDDLLAMIYVQGLKDCVDSQERVAREAKAIGGESVAEEILDRIRSALDGK